MNPLELYLLSLNSENSRRQTKSVCKAIFGFSDEKSAKKFNWKQLTHHFIIKKMGELEAKGLTYRTINAYLSILKGIARQCWNLGKITSVAFMHIDHIPNRKGFREVAGRKLEHAEVEALFSVCANDRNKTRGARSAAMLALGIFMGLRREEIAKLKRDDLDFDSGTCKVTGKGNKQVRIPIASLAVPYLEAWFNQCREQGVYGRYVFGSIHSSGKIFHLSGIRGEAVRYSYKRVVSQSNIKNKTTPHDMRRTLITNLLDQNISPRVVQAIARHSKVDTTLGYDRGDMSASMQQAINVMSNVYRL
ncbi:MAG: site-specific integrase [Thiotrichales bacterium]|nr:site-specific integrase [Thiotrichales bacterium]